MPVSPNVQGTDTEILRYAQDDRERGCCTSELLCSVQQRP
jgi:hypothetical protein